jgi:hypothetical protein
MLFAKDWTLWFKPRSERPEVSALLRVTPRWFSSFAAS